MDFHWNGDQLTEEIPVGTDGKPEYENAIRWIYEPGSFTPLARYEKGLLHYAVTDTVGRVQELLTEDGTIVWWGKQQLWGREEGRNKDDAPDCQGKITKARSLQGLTPGSFCPWLLFASYVLTLP